MSIIFENDNGTYISHEQFINNVYKYNNNNWTFYGLNPNLFKIFIPYNLSKIKSKRLAISDEDYDSKEPSEVKLKFYNFIESEAMKLIFTSDRLQCDSLNNKQAIETADCIYKNLQNSILDLVGRNIGPCVIKEINNSNYLFPENCKFFAKDVVEIKRHLENKKFEFILLDPPWWNKYIRRKRKASSDAYNMMYNHDLKSLPIGDLLTDDGLLAVWCTNSEQNMNALLNDIFPHWNVNFTAKWYWIKITTKGEPVCDFSKPPGKQPYEKLLFAYRNRSLPLPIDGKLLVSVPSAIHSHKPPIVDVLKEFLPKDPECLEVFARYLLPNWTSYGNEVLKLQHESLFVAK